MNKFLPHTFALLGIGLGIALGGCQTEPPGFKETGFLSDYSRLEPVDGRTLRYIAPAATVRGYRGFLVEPVVVRIAEGAASGPEAQMRDASTRATGYLREQLEAGYYRIASGPAAGVARVRAAITEYDPANDRLGIEGELVDSITGEQIIATVSDRLTGPDLDRVMRRWAERLRLRLDEINGVPPAAASDLPAPVGFLSTYRNLSARGPASLSYVDPSNRLADYDKFMIIPVQLYFHEQAKPLGTPAKDELRTHLQKAMIRSLGRNYQVVTESGPGVAEIHVALTDVKESSPVLNAIPRLKLADFGLGGMSMESEIVDSVSGVQLAALVESALGRNLSWDPSSLDDAKAACDAWVARAVRAIDDAKARAGR